MELQQVQRVSQAQTQELNLSRMQMQSLQVLAAPLQELQTQITAALEANPVLEVLDYGNELLAGNPIEQTTAAAAGDEERAAELAAYDESYCDYVETGAAEDVALDAALPDFRHNADDDERRRHFFDSLTNETNGQETLYEQLRDVADGDAEILRVGEAVLNNLEGNGYLCASDAELAEQTGADLETVERIVALVQTFDPPGIAARTLRECLLLQLERAHEEETLAWRLVDTQLEQVGANQIPKVAKALGTSISEVNEALARIRQLEPRPGYLLNGRSSLEAIPEAFIVGDGEGGWRVVMNSRSCPVLGIESEYQRLAKDKTTPVEVRKYLRGCISSGNQFIQSLADRRSTIQRITEILAERQSDFMAEGVGKLRPMTMLDVAAELGVHETTVSRAIADKYVRTPQGLFEYRYFFTVGYARSGATSDVDELGGEQVSSRAIRQRIRELIDNEDPEHPLSDQKILELLAREGVDISRRTVAKYRESDGIPKTSQRRVHHD